MVLAKLVEHQADMTVSQLSHRLNVSNPAISRTLKQLEVKQWIERLPHHEDRRNILVHMTEKGHDIYKQTVQLVSQQKANCLANIELAELEQFIHIGHKIADALMACKEDDTHETID